MSFTFQIQSNNSLSFADLSSALAEPALRSIEAVDPAVAMSGIYHIYVDDVSCRGVELETQPSGFSVKICSPASPEDHKLALHLVKTICDLSNAESVKGESQEIIKPDKLAEKYGDAWLQQEVEFGVKAILSAAGDITDGAACSMRGAIRYFHVGLRLAVELLALPSPADIEREFFKRFQSVQYIDKQGYYCPKVYVNKNTRKKLCGIGPNVSYLVPWVQHLALLNEEGGEPVFVPRNEFFKLIRPRLKWVDEKQAVMAAIPTEEWNELIVQAEKFKEVPATLN